MKLKLEVTSTKPQAASNKHQKFFKDPVFNHPDLWYNIWLDGLIEYLEGRHKRQASKILDPKDQASSCAQPPSSPSNE